MYVREECKEQWRRATANRREWNQRHRNRLVRWIRTQQQRAVGNRVIIKSTRATVINGCDTTAVVIHTSRSSSVPPYQSRPGCSRRQSSQREARRSDRRGRARRTGGHRGIDHRGQKDLNFEGYKDGVIDSEWMRALPNKGLASGRGRR